jgi:predicted secreted protein
MAILKGKDGTVSIGGNSVGDVSSWSVSIETDTLETTAMGTAGWKTHVGSLQSWSGSVELYLADNATVSTYTAGTDAAVVLTDGTSGNTYTGTAIVTSVSVDVGVADLVTMTLDLTGDGALALS